MKQSANQIQMFKRRSDIERDRVLTKQCKRAKIETRNIMNIIDNIPELSQYRQHIMTHITTSQDIDKPRDNVRRIVESNPTQPILEQTSLFQYNVFDQCVIDNVSYWTDRYGNIWTEQLTRAGTYKIIDGKAKYYIDRKLVINRYNTLYDVIV